MSKKEFHSIDSVMGELLSPNEVDEVRREARQELEEEAYVSAQEAAVMLQAGPEAIKNWLESSSFPGAYFDGANWQLPLAVVESIARRDKELRDQNAAGDLSLWDVDEDVEPPLL